MNGTGKENKAVSKIVCREMVAPPLKYTNVSTASKNAGASKNGQQARKKSAFCCQRKIGPKTVTRDLLRLCHDITIKARATMTARKRTGCSKICKHRPQKVPTTVGRMTT